MDKGATSHLCMKSGTSSELGTWRAMHEGESRGHISSESRKKGFAWMICPPKRTF